MQQTGHVSNIQPLLILQQPTIYITINIIYKNTNRNSKVNLCLQLKKLISKAYLYLNIVVSDITQCNHHLSQISSIANSLINHYYKLISSIKNKLQKCWLHHQRYNSECILSGEKLTIGNIIFNGMWHGNYTQWLCDNETT